MSKYNTKNQQFQTGSTRPPKSHGGIIAFLLILVIFLSGIVSILGLMNIHLFRLLESEKNQDISLHVRTAPSQPGIAKTALDCGDLHSTLGIYVQDITPFYEQYYDLPSGVYLSQVVTGSDAHAQGLRCGDVLTRFNGQTVTDCASLCALVETQTPGSTVELTVMRGDVELTVRVVIAPTEE